MHLGEVGRELGLLELAGGDILVRLDHIAPWPQPRHGLDRNLKTLGFPALLIALKLGELGAQDGVAHLAELLGVSPALIASIKRRMESSARSASS
jgi:hypothetical protein